ncbi:GspE/PulE family protein [Armatimonas rosea]|uniref:Type II secretory ATPase GspE/PulE/Tfp pilus assembly ATPase PilB-like protein n=1 Tax=Armatimonas rosea TaxID=685828 RepID=A0A7W9SQA0_ARMRO|nr:GspE/PulE family protein [Armatimonas rosea]MBB6050840.1 type II secretory ATPase GspE/PulE/Tfp pilus assembly ATPase PilB-like protein [Armatimonas rosea]
MPGSGPGGTSPAIQGPAVQMVNAMVNDAVRLGASDIHIEPRANCLEVRLRVDGVLQTWKELPKDLQDPVAVRIKVLADLDINEKRLPQDGRIAITMPGKSFDLRISSLPVLYGEKIVMRLLDRSMSVRPLQGLDFSPHNQETFEELIRQPLGLVLVTGPTGSGKTTTLYSALNVLRSKATNIVTCEDPVEVNMEGINQSAVNEKVGLTFARQLRAILRQDPDIILVGEMRDQETAEIAFRAAMTGHLVLSTLHSNDAPTSVTRLIDMGVPPFLIASGLVGMAAQRLVRRLCVRCRRQAPPTPRQAALLGISDADPIWQPAGCSECEGTGYKGRIGVHEVVTVDEKFSRLIIDKAPSSILRRASIDAGMVPIREDALNKIRAGLTSAEDVMRQVYLKADDDEDKNWQPPGQPAQIAASPVAALPAAS